MRFDTGGFYCLGPPPLEGVNTGPPFLLPFPHLLRPPRPEDDALGSPQTLKFNFTGGPPPPTTLPFNDVTIFLTICATYERNALDWYFRKTPSFSASSSSKDPLGISLRNGPLPACHPGLYFAPLSFFLSTLFLLAMLSTLNRFLG